ncbi:MAG: hypothetical protein V4671_07055 [Armatimonadota bacterium]
MNSPGSLWLAAAYTIAALMYLVAGVRERQTPTHRPYSLLLFALGLLLWLLALQQVSGVLAGVTEMVRQQSRVEGWYNDRRDLQAAAVKAIPLAGAVAAMGLLWWVRRFWKRYLLVLVTLIFLVCFAAIQAVSFHNIDYLLRSQVGGATIKTWINLFGLLLVTVSLSPFLKIRRAPRP